MVRSLLAILTVLVIAQTLAILTPTAYGGEDGPTAYKGDEAENFLFQIPIDRYRNSHLNDPPYLPFDPIRGVAITPRDSLIWDGTVESRLGTFVANGITHFRFDLTWEYIQADSTTWKYADVDELMDIVDRVGGEPIVILAYGTPWAMQAKTNCKNKTVDTFCPPKPNKWDAWATYVDSIATRFGDQVDYYEIWNEQDYYKFWYGSVSEYRLMLSKADSVLALRDPTAKVILGGLTCRMHYDEKWLDELVDAQSYQWFDIIGVHAYSAGQHHVLSVLERVFVEAEGLLLKDIWVTETGYPSDEVVRGEISRRAHPQSQVDYVHRTMSRWRHPKVEAVFWFNGFDRPEVDGLGDKWNMGLLDTLGVKKPAFDEWANWQDPLIGDPLEASFDLNRAHPYRGIYPVEAAFADVNGLPVPPDCVNDRYPTHAEQVDLTLADGSVIKTRRFSGADDEFGLHFDVDDAWFYNNGEPVALEIEYVAPQGADFILAYDSAACTATEEFSVRAEADPTADCIVDPALPDSSIYVRRNCDDVSADTLDVGGELTLHRSGYVIEDAGFLNSLAAASDIIARYDWSDCQNPNPIYIKSLSVHKAPRELVTHPTGGEVYYSDQLVELRWETRYQASIPIVDIVAHLDGGAVVDTLVTGLENLGGLDWEITGAHVSSDVQLEVIYHNYWNLWTRSERTTSFAILRAPEGVFANKSMTDQGDPIMDYQGRPYASVSFDYDDDGDEDLFITQRGGDVGVFYENIDDPVANKLEFVNRRLEAFPADRPGEDLHAPAVADYDLDGDMDLVVTATPSTGEDRGRLYRNNGNGTFTDVTYPMSMTQYLENSWVAAWGDYDGDNLPDLFIGRGVSVPGEPGDIYPRNLMPDLPYLMRNRTTDPELNDFWNVSNPYWTGIHLSSNDPGIACIAAAWSDVDADGDLDLIAGSMHPDYNNSGSRLYINENSVFTEEWDYRIGHYSGPVSAVEPGRMAQPSATVPDLVLGIWDSQLNQPEILWNDGTGFFPLNTYLGAGFATSSLRLLDFGRDGRLDILALPDQDSGATNSPKLFVNYPTLTGSPEFIDRTVESGLYSIGGAYGATIADFDGDGREDIYLGRETSSSAFYFRGEKQNPTGPPIEFQDPVVCAKLDGNGAFERNGLGAQVFLLADGVPVQVLEPTGSAGRGGQRPATMLFGLAGASTENLQVQITWPDGYVQTTSVDTSGVHDIPYGANPSLQLSTVSHQVAFDGPGINELTFTWQTLNATSIYLDKVYLTPLGSCGGPQVLSHSTPNVTFDVVRLPSGNYQHTVVASAQDCTAGCTYSYYCQSATNTQVSNHASNPKTFKTKLCAQ